MPLGLRQNNNLLHLTLDIWQEQIFFNEAAYPSGYFAAEILNVNDETLRELFTHGGGISHQMESLVCAEQSRFVKLLPELRSSVEKILDALWQCPPYSMLDKEQELRAIELLFSDASVRDLMEPESPARQFFFRYLTAVFSIPLGIFHFSVAGRYFEEGYLQRLKKRTETSFAVAAHDCFNSEQFWDEMRSLQSLDMEPFTVYPELSSTYVFARSPKNEKEMVFVERVYFLRLTDFYTYDLLNGLHHGHAPSQCQGCGKYFLTTNGHIPKYCDGVAPQDDRYTCRQYGAMMRQKEQNKQHPVYRLFNTRTGTIRKHHQRGKISDDLRREALYLAESYRDKALMDNDYAESGYAQSMELEHIYAEAEKRLK